MDKSTVNWDVFFRQVKKFIKEPNDHMRTRYPYLPKWLSALVAGISGAWHFAHVSFDAMGSDNFGPRGLITTGLVRMRIADWIYSEVPHIHHPMLDFINAERKLYVVNLSRAGKPRTEKELEQLCHEMEKLRKECLWELTSFPIDKCPGDHFIDLLIIDGALTVSQGVLLEFPKEVLDGLEDTQFWVSTDAVAVNNILEKIAERNQ